MPNFVTLTLMKQGRIFSEILTGKVKKGSPGLLKQKNYTHLGQIMQKTGQSNVMCPNPRFQIRPEAHTIYQGSFTGSRQRDGHDRKWASLWMENRGRASKYRNESSCQIDFSAFINVEDQDHQVSFSNNFLRLAMCLAG